MSDVAAISAALASRAFRFVTEDDLQRGIAEAFVADGITHGREVVLSKKDRIDFMVGRVGLEVKIGGSISALTAQLIRYAGLPEIDELVLVTSQYRLGNLPATIGGKPLTVVTIPRGFQ